MITNFEELTQELTPKEIELLPTFITGLKSKIGKENVVTNKQIIQRLKQGAGINVSEARVRKIINFIRTNDLVSLLIATSEGYYIATEKKEVEKYIESLWQRENEIRRVRESITRQFSKTDFTLIETPSPIYK